MINMNVMKNTVMTFSAHCKILLLCHIDDIMGSIVRYGPNKLIANTETALKGVLLFFQFACLCF